MLHFTHLVHTDEFRAADDGCRTERDRTAHLLRPVPHFAHLVHIDEIGAAAAVRRKLEILTLTPAANFTHQHWTAASFQITF